MPRPLLQPVRVERKEVSQGVNHHNIVVDLLALADNLQASRPKEPRALETEQDPQVLERVKDTLRNIPRVPQKVARL